MNQGNILDLVEPKKIITGSFASKNVFPIGHDSSRII